MDHNEVCLAGKLSKKAEEILLPSGDLRTTWRVIVRRARPRPGAVVDTIPCVTFDPEVAAVVQRFLPGDRMRVEGVFRSRVWGPPQTKIWAYEVEALAVTPAGELPEAEAPAVPRPREAGV
ncbi:single-stranded DNA-binding protein [Nonomuraea sp. NBC_01738]|uniref:single-stranded DNA-binding protein n=1 Tax=Nonomuraea sp. NBC_01738 TaxID=2976003 RepID=UPI002E12115A|nr:single-stranded DNA-binding protein [Nonomuraea sp. NBC_01738]